MIEKLLWKPYQEDIIQTLLKPENQAVRSWKYVAILFFGENIGSQVYTKLKQKFGDRIWCLVRILWQEKEYKVNEVFELITTLNNDDSCIGIIVQLPLPEYMQKYRGEILTHISPYKDIDGLWGQAFWKSLVLEQKFMPATPAAVYGLLDYYGYGKLQGKVVAILGQSLLVWSPLATILMQQWASVFCCNEYTDQTKVKSICQQSDIIISCTWVIHLVDETYIRKDNSQVIIDVGYGQLNWKSVWDVQFDNIAKYLKAYSPVPGWVWPVTIAKIFTNILHLHKLQSSHHNQ